MDREELIRERVYTPVVKEIDRDLLRLEKQKLEALAEEEYEEELKRLEKSILLLEELDIITALDAWHYNLRIQKLREREIMLANKETMCIVDDLENPLERSIRYHNEEKMHAQRSRDERVREL